MLTRESLLNALYALHEGVVLLNADSRVVFWNDWMAKHSGIGEGDARDLRLNEIFSQDISARLRQAVHQCIEQKQSAVISQSLHTQLLPLYRPEEEDPTPAPLQQFIVIRPIQVHSGTHFCLIQVEDVSKNWRRESLLREQTCQLSVMASQHRRREARARAVIENIHDAIVSMDTQGRITDLNRAAHEMFALDDTQVLGKPADILFNDYAAHQAELAAGREVELQGRHHSGSVFSAAVGMSRIESEGQDRCILIVRDISAQKQAEESLHWEKEFAQITLQSIQEAVITTDAKGRVNSVNRSACELLRRNEEHILDRPLVDLLAFSELDHRRAARQGINATLSYGKSCSMDGLPELRFDNQESIFVNGRLAPLRSSGGAIVGSVAVLQDVTNDKRMREILSYQATHDDLTSLINRREFERRLEEALSTRVGDTHHMLLYLDLDQFKLINDNCGHTAGDQMLRQLTSLLGTRLRHTDTLARLGGDEFAVLLPYCGLEVGRRIAEELRELVRNFRFNWGGRSFSVGVSIGIVQLDETMLDISDALAAADSACYIAKEKGRDQVIVHQPGGDEEQLRKGQISQAARIRESLELGRFRLWAQPIIPIHPEKFDWGVEILVRMQNENGELVPPGMFIPAAERYNLMGHIDSWVISALCKQWTEQPELFERADKVAINLSGQSIGNDEFLEFAMTEIENHRLPWHKLCFEVTETAAVSNIEKACHFINILKGCGARFSLDDFGSGLSSFAYLKQLPVDYLKIDGAFVKDMLNDRIDAAMVRSISDVGRAMHLYTIAEFVEDLAVVDALRDAKVDYAQGYGICKPMPIEKLSSYRPAPLIPALAVTSG